MNIETLEKKLVTLVTNLVNDEFIYDFLLAYGQPKASITRLKQGDYNLSKTPRQVLWKKKLCFKYETKQDLHGCIDELTNDPAVAKQHPRFIIVTDFKAMLSVDTKTGDTLDIRIDELPQHFDFFLPWAGMEKSQLQSENPADIKAAEKMGRLYDLILADNPPESDTDRHALNVFLSRLLFCFFAEDTEIFSPDQFTNAIASHTAEDGSNLQTYLQRLFTVLNSRDRSEYPKYLRDFPFVNGGLFADESPVPTFCKKSRNIIIECGNLNWQAINPDIFGSMIQAVVHDEMRSSKGVHYTSTVNIMKVIEPLFLDALRDALESAGNSPKKLQRFLDRIYNIRIFDPACGSGNFLILSYKELCKLEIEAFKRLHGEQRSFRFQANVKLTQFFGIELDDFAQQTARLSLWLAEHQMNQAFREVFGSARPTLPLQEGGNIVCANATRVDWNEVCPNDQDTELYVLGNPPYSGQRNHTDFHREDMGHVFRGEKNYKKLDYIACWFNLAAKYLGDHTKVSFVTTTSICQGTQVAMLWPRVFNERVEIFFAYAPFKWSNNARDNAGVTCTVIGLRRPGPRPKFIYVKGVRNQVKHINAYLVEGPDVVVQKRLAPISLLPKMSGGNQPREGGHLVLTDDQKNKLIADSPDVARFLRPLVGSGEFIKGTKRWCIWIDDERLLEAQAIPELKQRIELVRKHRESGNSVEKSFAHVPHRFVTVKRAKSSQVLIPIVSSENRRYIPIGMLDADVAVTSKAFVIFDCEPYVFGVLNSLMHMLWVKAVSGRLKSDISYSSQMCYNTFAFPSLTDSQKKAIEERVFAVLDAREYHPEKTMAQLYEAGAMPDDLSLAHQHLDREIERCYRDRPFGSDEARLTFLLDEYVGLKKLEEERN